MLYHIIPSELKGHVLHPLNILKVKYPELYESLIPKYEGREHVLRRQIPILDCLWNDVLHLSPIHPAKLKQAHTDAGVSWASTSFFEIDPVRAGITSSNAVVFRERWVIKDEIPQLETETTPFSSTLLPSLSNVLKATRHHYERCVQQKQPPFTFAFVPHILFKGEIPLKDLHILEA